MLDDASDSTQTVLNVKKLLSEAKIDALIGPSGSPNAVGVVAFIAEAGTPMLAPVGTTSVVLPMDDKKRWVFKTTQNDGLICDALIRHMVKSGVKTIGFIGFNDPYGDNWYAEITAQAQKAGIRIVANERFVRTDTSVAGQVAKLMTAKPDAVLVGAAGGPTVLPHITLVDAGYKGRIYQTHGAATPDFLRLGGPKVEGTVLAASLMLVLPEIADNVPSKALARSTSTPTKRCTAASRRPSAPTSTTPDCSCRAPSRKPRSAANPARRSSGPRCAMRSRRRASSSAPRACTT